MRGWQATVRTCHVLAAAGITCVHYSLLLYHHPRGLGIHVITWCATTHTAGLQVLVLALCMFACIGSCLNTKTGVVQRSYRCGTELTVYLWLGYCPRAEHAPNRGIARGCPVGCGSGVCVCMRLAPWRQECSEKHYGSFWLQQGTRLGFGNYGGEVPARKGG